MTKQRINPVWRRVPIVLILLIAVDVWPAVALADDPPTVLWNNTLAAPPGFPRLIIQGRGVAIGPDQNPVVVGQILGFPLTTTVVVKYHRITGAEVWRSAALAVPFGRIGGVAIGSDGAIFVGGDGRRTAFSPPRYFAAKYTSTGQLLFMRFIDSAGTHSDAIGGIAVGRDGNPVLTGVAQMLGQPGPPAFTLLTVKVSGLTLGTVAEARAPFANVPNELKEAGVAVSSSNEIFVTGTSASTIKYDARLSHPLWTSAVHGRKIAVRPGNVDDDDDYRGRRSERHDGDGEQEEVAVIATTKGAAAAGCTAVTQDFEVTKLDGTAGVPVWVRTYDSCFNDVPRGVAIDQDGNILVTGERNSAPFPQFNEGLTVSFDAEGALRWVAAFDSGATPFGTDIIDAFFAIAVGRDSNPVVTGYSNPPALMRTIMYRVEEDHEREDEPQLGTVIMDSIGDL